MKGYHRYSMSLIFLQVLLSDTLQNMYQIGELLLYTFIIIQQDILAGMKIEEHLI